MVNHVKVPEAGELELERIKQKTCGRCRLAFWCDCYCKKERHIHGQDCYCPNCCDELKNTNQLWLCNFQIHRSFRKEDLGKYLINPSERRKKIYSDYG